MILNIIHRFSSKSVVNLCKTFVMKVIITLYLTLFVFLTFAQNGTIKGVVKDEKNNEPLPFTNIIISGTQIGSTSDFEGNFIITGVPVGFVRLQATSVGYNPYLSEEFQVTNSNETYIEIYLTQKTTTLSTVTITNQIFAKNIESPVAMQSIGLSEIEKNPGGNRDISKVVQSFPGVGQTPVQRNDLIVRGGGANENRFFLDGIEFPNLNHFATQGASGGPASIVNADFLREVDFYTGSFQVNHGNAMSSVLNMSLITPNKDKSEKRIVLGASDFGLSFNGPLTEKSGLLFSYRRSYLQFLFQALGLPFLPTYDDYMLKYRMTIGEKNQLSIISIGALDKNRLNLERNETEEQRYILSYLPETDQWNYTFGIVYRHFRENGFDNYIVSRNMFRNKSYKYQDNIEADSLKVQDYSSDEIENKFRFERINFLNSWRLMTGVSAEYAKYYNSTYQKIFLNGNSTLLDYDSSLDFYKFGFFSQISGKILKERLGVTLGFRLDGNTYSDEMLNPLNQISPRLSLSYGLNERWYLNGSIGHYKQLPAYTTLGYSESGVLVNKANDLKYIGVTHYIAGIEFLPNDESKITLEGFYKDYGHYPVSLRDSVSLANKGGDFGVVGDEPVESVGEGRAYGFEVLYRRKIIDKMTMLVTYTFVRSEFTGFDNEYIASAWDARNIVNVLVSRKFKRNWTFGLKWKYSGGSPYTPYDEYTSSLVQAWNIQGRPYLNYSAYNSERLSSFHQLDVRIDKEYFFDKWSLNIYMDVQNFYNFQYEGQDNLIPATDNSGNNIIVNPLDPAELQRYEMKTLENVGGSIVPTLGIIVEF
ncbi:MAG: TonB-dependent receptor [Marinilabiliales bacterium]|nr:MAG: TonB-dependent receptor [Marinilabiliales bacterium]